MNCSMRMIDCELAKSARPVSLLFIFCLLFFQTAYGQDLKTVISGVQQRYLNAETVKGSFQQTFQAPGIRQEESGEFWLKRPGLMRWEYRSPLEQLFVADGREFFFYVPEDRQVTIRPLTAADLRNTPLDLLLGSGKIEKNFVAVFERQSTPRLQGSLLLRLTPRQTNSEFLHLVLEVDSRTYEIRRIVMHQPGNSTSEFLFNNVILNARLNKKLFQFKIPKGIEVIRSDNEQ